MSWDQIEIKWFAMTRRVRPDLCVRAPGDVTTARQGGEAAGASMTDRVAPAPAFMQPTRPVPERIE